MMAVVSARISAAVLTLTVMTYATLEMQAVGSVSQGQAVILHLSQKDRNAAGGMEEPPGKKGHGQLFLGDLPWGHGQG